MRIFKMNQVFKDEKCIGGKTAGRSFRKDKEVLGTFIGQITVHNKREIS